MFKAKIDENKTFQPLGIAVLAVSDTRDLESDTSGALLKSMLEESGHTCIDRQIVTDDAPAIQAVVKAWMDNPEIDVVLTTGGTGFSGRDVTPEAIEPLFTKRMEGFSALFHAYSAEKIGTSTMQSRATAGLADTTYVFVLPGSRGACRDAWDGILQYQLDSRHMPCNLVEVIPRLGE